MFHQNNMSSIIGSDLSINGDISVKGNLLIYGKINGNVICNGILTMSKGSLVKGDVKTLSADISGTVEGNLEAKEKVSLSSASVLNGNLLASILVIEDGASFNGLCTMGSKQSIPITTKTKMEKIASLNDRTKK
tara:strand:+ start:164 stop:565 length:402 start_codon:yes stop_codon:yes gene_type:complete